VHIYDAGGAGLRNVLGKDKETAIRLLPTIKNATKKKIPRLGSSAKSGRGIRREESAGERDEMEGEN